ncbi:MAG: hypothetical protein A2Y15_02595 [Clostridiales bacterium GWF2_36_10]|nr:MAG: hypothetical protein A2Y15_02595 [Clostridiales bacterium GWF2_36_10]
MKFNQHDIKWLKEHIKDSQKVVLLAHDYPDGDAVGSVVVMNYIIQAMGAEPIVVLRNFDKLNWDFLGFKEEIKIYSDEELETITSIPVTIVLDCSNQDRLGEQKVYLTKSTYVVNIDHHADNNNFGTINIVKESSSVGEILYYLIKDLGIPITRKMAYSILVSIASDTGRFMYNNTHQNLFFIIHDLFNYLNSNDYSEIMRILYQEVSIDKIRLTAEIFNNLEMIHNVISFSYLESDCGFIDGLVEPIQSIQGSRASVLVRKIDHRIKISFRAKDKNIDVQLLAQQFGGGGHIHASGATIALTDFSKQILDIKEIVRMYFSKYL